MCSIVELHRDEPGDLADGIKVFVDGGWVLVLPDPDMPRYHIIVSMEDSEKARALADRYSAMVKTAVGGDSGTPAATRQGTRRRPDPHFVARPHAERGDRSGRP